MAEINRAEYDASFGPTVGDRIRLADTNLFIEVTEDRCVGGDEAVFGGGKSIRESMGQSRATRADGTPDLVITGAVILDHWGIIKADVGIRDGRIVALAGPGQVDEDAASTVDGIGLVLAPGFVDPHTHYDAQLFWDPGASPSNVHGAASCVTVTVWPATVIGALRDDVTVFGETL